MKKTPRALLLALVLTFLATTLVSATHDRPAWLTRQMGPPNAATYTVYYATECPAGETRCTDSDGDGTPDTNELVPATDSDGNGFPDAVETMSGYLEGSRSAFVGTYRMLEPWFDGAPSRPAYMSGGCWGSYNGHSIYMCAGGTSADWVQAKATAAHELFHGTQWAYGVGQPGWVIEGQAAFMEDETFADLDADPGTFLFSQGSGYLADPNGNAITRSSYSIAWFWKYFAEQFGTSPNPGQGMDAIKRFWDEARASGRSGIDAVNRALAVLRPGTTFEDVFKDFVMANYARKLDGVPAKYRFADEAEPRPGPLRAVRLDVDQSLTPADQVGPLISDVNAWGARYYSVAPAADVPIISFDLHQDTANRVFYGLLAIKDNRIVLEERTVGRHYARALPNAAYDRVVLVVAGLDHYANYRLTVNGSRPTLNVVDPLQVRPAEVGSPSSPEKFLLKVEVLSPAGQPVEGIDPASFSIRVGSAVVPRDRIVTGAYVQGQYWLLVRAPDQAAAGTYDLSVEWGPLSDTEPQAVVYRPRPTTDTVIVLDRSGSMADFNKITAAKNAARLYIDSWRDGEQLGVVSFNGDATVNRTLTVVSAASRASAKSAVNALTAIGATSIGDGAISGMNELVARGNPSDAWAIVLLSDGMETDPQWISDFLAAYTARRDARQKVPQVHTIALGPDADRVKMQDLANATGGTYQYAAEPGALMSDIGVTATDATLDLAEMYRIAAEAVDLQQQIFSQRVTFPAQVLTLDVPIQVDRGASEGLFTLNWAEDGLTSPSIKLLRPDGSEVTASPLTDATHRFWRVSNPPSGTWRLRLNCSGVEFCRDHFLVEAALRSPLAFDLLLNPAPAERRLGRPIDLLTTLADTAPVRGATVSAEITAPNGTISTVRLYDDGAHGDGAANDGLYGNRFFRTFQPGSYIVHASASGTSNLGSPFVRRVTRAFDIAPDQDSDQDGMPDSWEKEHGTNPSKADAKADPDLDKLTNLDEYLHGTNPNDPDTDDGGQNDGSEVLAQKDPLNPADDGIKTTGELYVKPGHGLNLITFRGIGYDHFIIFRSTSQSGDYTLLNDGVPPTGVFSDTEVSDGTTYWYRIAAVGLQGQISSLSDPIAGTPKLDPIAPGGSVVINNGAPTTSSRQVMLRLSARGDAGPHTPAEADAQENNPAGADLSTSVAAMRVSNDPTFSGAAWEPYAASKSWQLAATSGPAIVYVQFRDSSGNVSEPATDAIVVQQAVYLPLLQR